jgi:putative DNA primase/helicase
VKAKTIRPSVKLLGVGRDARTGEWHRVIQVRNLDGIKKLIAIPFANSAESAVCNAIGKAGYPVPIVAKEKRLLLTRLSDVTSASRLSVTSSSGWVCDKAFVTPLRAYTTGGETLVMTENVQDEHRFHQSGTLKGWQRGVLRPSFENSNAMFAIMLAFVGPVMRLVDASNCGFHLVADSSRGKSIVLVAAGSVWGGGDGPLGFVRTWHATSNALDPLAASHSETFLALDESKLAGENPKEAANTVLHASYRLGGGQEKRRQTDKGPRLQWLVPVLGSSEEALSDMAKTAGQTLSWGQLVRSIDIRADAGRSMGVWEELHDTSVSPALFADRLRNAALEYHGVAGDAFLTALVDAASRRREWLQEFLDERIRKYLKAVGSTGWEATQERIANWFALVYAAGGLAFKLGILPWEWKPRLAAVRSCHQRIILPTETHAAAVPEDTIVAVRTYIAENLAVLLILDRVPSHLRNRISLQRTA